MSPANTTPMNVGHRCLFPGLVIENAWRSRSYYGVVTHTGSQGPQVRTDQKQSGETWTEGRAREGPHEETPDTNSTDKLSS